MSTCKVYFLLIYIKYNQNDFKECKLIGKGGKSEVYRAYFLNKKLIE